MSVFTDGILPPTDTQYNTGDLQTKTQGSPQTYTIPHRLQTCKYIYTRVQRRLDTHTIRHNTFIPILIQSVFLVHWICSGCQVDNYSTHNWHVKFANCRFHLNPYHIGIARKLTFTRHNTSHTVNYTCAPNTILL